MTLIGAIRLISLGLLLCGCAVPSLERQALDAGMHVSQTRGTGFKHRLFTSESAGAGGALIVLLDGDGHAFLDRHTVARDPTAHRSWLLDLAPELTRIGSVVYLGRPCYHQLQDPACTPRLWTVARYGNEVVASLARVVAARRQTGQPLVLVGYSGGGVLALLVAAQLQPGPAGVVTVAAPLDVAAWTDYHGYTPLMESQDPADDPDRFRRLCRRHLFGRDDRVVPPALTSAWRWPMDETTATVDSDHAGGWQESAREAVIEVLGFCAAPLERQGVGG